jgi:predicted TIM-barrel fold metal-dependent hydrolase
MHRREFLAAGAAAAALPTVAKDSPKMLPVIDTHQHLWDLSRVKLGWLKKGSALDASYTPKEYAAATDGLNVVKAVYMEVDVVPEDKQKEVDYVVALCESGKTPTCAGVLGGVITSDGFAKYAAQFKGSKYVKGIRQVMQSDSTPPGTCLKPEVVKNVRLLGELGLSFDLCVRPKELPDFIKLVDECPDTRFILDHCGNPQAKWTNDEWDGWRKNMAEMAKRKHVVCKVSGFVVNGWEKGKWKPDDLAPAVNGTIDAFGWDRVMFGGDWPVVLNAGSYKDWLTALRAIIADRPEADQKKLLHDNAAKVYGI